MKNEIIKLGMIIKGMFNRKRNKIDNIVIIDDWKENESLEEKPFEPANLKEYQEKYVEPLNFKERGIKSNFDLISPSSTTGSPTVERVESREQKEGGR